MNDRIEEKMTKFTKMVFISFFAIFFSMIVEFAKSLLSTNIDKTGRAFFIMFIFMGLPAMIFWGVVFLKSATKLILENDSLIVKQTLRKPISIQLNQLKRVDTWGNVESGRHFYIIKSEFKNFNTSLISFQLRKARLDIFMEELKCRVDKAKQEK